jgi:hypothetical protein
VLQCEALGEEIFAGERSPLIFGELIECIYFDPCHRTLRDWACLFAQENTLVVSHKLGLQQKSSRQLRLVSAGTALAYF